MVVRDFNVKSVAPFVFEAQPPLIVDADTPRPFSIASQSLQPVPWRASQIYERLCGIKHLKLPLGHDGD
jgi:hypothetical protein